MVAAGVVKFIRTRPATAVCVGFLLGAVVAVSVGYYWWAMRGGEAGRVRAILLKNPQILADSPDVLAAARTLLQARRQSAEGEARARLLAGRWAALTHPAFSPTLGNPAAGSVLIEFTDYACEPCRASAPAVADILPSHPNLRVALMLLPTGGPIAEFAARVAYVAYQQNPAKFARFHQLLMGGHGPLSEDIVLEAAAAAGLDVEQIRQDLGANTAQKYLAQVRSFAEELNVAGVPTVLMGAHVISGGVSNAQVADLVRSEPSAVSAAPLPALDFSLTDEHGRHADVANFRGRWLIVYFGFTQCPDLCPAALLTLSSALRALGSDAERLQAVFVTLDPAHDTPDVLTRYLGSFGPRFVGLTGTPAQIAGAADRFGVYTARSEDETSAPSSITHSSSFYVLDPQGRLSRQISSQLTTAQLIHYLRRSMAPDHPGGESEDASGG